jgi:hypothetical protein
VFNEPPPFEIIFLDSVVQKMLILYPVPFGALTQLRAGTSPEGAEMNGKVSYIIEIVETSSAVSFPELSVVPHTLGAVRKGITCFGRSETKRRVVEMDGGAGRGHLDSGGPGR